MTITVYTKPACVQCNATYKALDKQGLSYEVVDISEVPEARDYVMALGYLQAPVALSKYLAMSPASMPPLCDDSAKMVVSASRASGTRSDSQ